MATEDIPISHSAHTALFSQNQCVSQYLAPIQLTSDDVNNESTRRHRPSLCRAASSSSSSTGSSERSNVTVYAGANTTVGNYHARPDLEIDCDRVTSVVEEQMPAENVRLLESKIKSNDIAISVNNNYARKICSAPTQKVCIQKSPCRQISQNSFGNQSPQRDVSSPRQVPPILRRMTIQENASRRGSVNAESRKGSVQVRL